MSEPPGRWVVNCDGASRGNPGEAAIGCVVRDPAGVVRGRIGRRIGHTTNNQAEYRAALAGMESALALGARQIELRLDSELIVRQLQGRYRVRKPELMPLFDALRELASRCERFAAVHVPRAQNRDADALANGALDGLPVEEGAAP